MIIYHKRVFFKTIIINPPKSVSGGGCACACAGGGRAGCSVKDFYHTNIRSDKLKNVLSKKA